MSRYFGGRSPYVPVAKRRVNALKKLKSLEKQGKTCRPVTIEGRKITHTFWGTKWCDNLEAYSDFSNRLPRGRTYVRNGSVVDLQITTGKISALVSGSDMYEINIAVRPLEAKRWQAILHECAGKVSSLVELLQGRLSNAVMEVVTRQETGLLPTPKQIDFRCSCPDFASMCKHIAATLYGVGARLDHQPELLFQLCHVDPLELIQQASHMPVTEARTALYPHQQLDTDDLSSLFGIELDESPLVVSSPPATKKTPTAPKKKVTASLRTLTKTMSANDLLARGIPRHTQKNWLSSGVLLRTEARGVYQATPNTEKRIKTYLSNKRV